MITSEAHSLMLYSPCYVYIFSFYFFLLMNIFASLIIMPLFQSFLIPFRDCCEERISMDWILQPVFSEPRCGARIAAAGSLGFLRFAGDLKDNGSHRSSKRFVINGVFEV